MFIRMCPINETAAVVHLNGRLGVETGTALRDAVCGALRGGRHHLVFNLVGLSRVDAAGLGQLVQALNTIHAAGGELKLVLRQTSVLELMARTKLLGLFEVYPSERDAVASFASTSIATY
jgi:anti-sigma B factor antagonist